VARAEAELQGLRSQVREEVADALSIIDSHLLMLRDRRLSQRTAAIITREQINAEWALARSLEEIADRFNRIADPYLRERYQDIKFVADRVFGLLAGRPEEFVRQEEDPVILVSETLAPEDLIGLSLDRVQGFIAESGGLTAHGVIVARSLGLPAVVGVEDVTRWCASGDTVILDGYAGRIHLRPGPDQRRRYREYARQHASFEDELARYAFLRAETRDGYAVRLAANLERVDEVAAVQRFGAEGVGLFRSEFDFFRADRLPGEDELYQRYRTLLTAMAPHPVTIRTLDVGADKFLRHLPWLGIRLDRQPNPALGLRSIRFSLWAPELFRLQLRALLRASVHGRLRILFPLISSVEELVKVRELFDEERHRLRREGGAAPGDVEIGIMVEVPSAVLVAEALAAQVDFFAIGTNDLIQYALAIDRANEYVAHLYDPFHPAVWRLIAQVVEAAHGQGVEVGVCGEMAGDPVTVPILLGLGVDELSMRPSAIAYVKRMLRRSAYPRLARLAETLLSMEDSGEVRQYLHLELARLYPEEFSRP